MTITLNHTIVPAKDKQVAAREFAQLFGLAYKGLGEHFAPVKVNDGLTFLFDDDPEFESHHYAFHVSDAEFDAIFHRVQEAGLTYGSNQFLSGIINGLLKWRSLIARTQFSLWYASGTRSLGTTAILFKTLATELPTKTWTIVNCRDGHAYLAPVGSLELVQDCAVRYASAPVDGSAAPDVPGCFRVARGGSWTNDARHARSASWLLTHPGFPSLGFDRFRLARTL